MISRSLRQAGSWLSETIFPPVCHFCRQRCRPDETPIGLVCRRCLGQIPLRLGADRLVALRVDDQLEPAVCACHYKGLAKQALVRMKFADSPEISTVFAALITDALLRQGKTGADWAAVIAVPLHPGREAERGYNQAGLLAADIAARLQLPDWSATLGRSSSTGRQSELKTMTQRIQNVENAFYVSQPQLIQNQRLLLIDDILSTGATMQAARKALVAAGAASVSLAAAAS